MKRIRKKVGVDVGVQGLKPYHIYCGGPRVGESPSFQSVIRRPRPDRGRTLSDRTTGPTNNVAKPTRFSVFPVTSAGVDPPVKYRRSRERKVGRTNSDGGQETYLVRCCLRASLLHLTRKNYVYLWSRHDGRGLETPQTHSTTLVRHLSYYL